MNTFKIAVIGGTGKSGTYVVRQLLKHQFQLKLLLRHPGKFTSKNPLAEVIQGDARDYNSVLSLLKDCDVVISTLGQPKGENPIFSAATGNILKAMKACSIKRYIVTTGLNVNAPGDHKNEKAKAATDWMYQNFPDTTKDKQIEYDLLTKSDLDWTMIRLPMIKQTDKRFPVSIRLDDCDGEFISATDLAHFVVQQVTDKTYIQKSPFLSNL